MTRAGAQGGDRGAAIRPGELWPVEIIVLTCDAVTARHLTVFCGLRTPKQRRHRRRVLAPVLGVLQSKLQLAEAQRAVMVAIESCQVALGHGDKRCILRGRKEACANYIDFCHAKI